LRRGRAFNEQDTADAPMVAMISETLARRNWPEYPRGQDPVGQHVLLGGAKPIGVEIVGIAADVHEAGLSTDPGPEMYLDCAQYAFQTMSLIVHTSGDPKQMVNAVRAQVTSLDRDEPVSAIQTMDEVIGASVTQQKLVLVLLGIFAGMALALAVIGIYGVITYSVIQRTQEVGIRRALGAQQADILKLVVGQGLGLAFGGVVVGLGGAFALTRLISGLLFQVSPTDPATFSGIAILLVLVAASASYIPARRAARTDPMKALR
jgi:predicted permease